MLAEAEAESMSCRSQRIGVCLRCVRLTATPVVSQSESRGTERCVAASAMSVEGCQLMSRLRLET